MDKDSIGEIRRESEFASAGKHTTLAQLQQAQKNATILCGIPEQIDRDGSLWFSFHEMKGFLPAQRADTLFYACLHKPPPVFEPEIAFLASDHAGIAIPHPAHIGGPAAYVLDFVDLKNLSFVKKDLQRTQPSLCAEPHVHFHIPFPALHLPTSSAQHYPA